MSQKERIKSVDLLRGITVAAMIVVNNAGGKLSFAALKHSDWNGLTLCDMVFPSFLFIVGISTYLSLSKTNFALTRTATAKIARRAVTILLIGWAIHYIDYACHADFLPFAHFRLTGVLPRIAACYFLTAFIALSLNRRSITFIVALLLVAYSALLLIGNGYANDESNLLVNIDRSLLGEAHLYAKRPVDPEGLISTIGALSHTLIGFCFGAILCQRDATTSEKMLKMMTYGFFLLLAGAAIATVLPINKRIWSPSYTLVGCGLVALALGALAYIADIRGKGKCLWPFDVFGINPLFLYALSELTAIAMSATGAKKALYSMLSTIIPDPYFASLAYSLLFVATMWAVGLYLYKKRIIIKI